MKTLLLILILLLPSLVLAEGVLGPAANPPASGGGLYDYRTKIEIQDDFMGSGDTTKIIGTLGWGEGGGDTTVVNGVANHYGLVRLATSAVINTVSYLMLNINSLTLVSPTLPYSTLSIIKVETVDANTAIWVGLGNSGVTEVPTNGIYFEHRTADTNWFCVTRAASAETRTDTGIAVSSINWITLEHIRSASDVQFKINGALVCTHTATIPTTSMTPSYVIKNLAAADKTALIDYFELRISGIVR